MKNAFKGSLSAVGAAVAMAQGVRAVFPRGGGNQSPCGAIGCALAQGNRVEIRSFGSFRPNYRPARTGRNPRTGDALPIA